MTSFEQLGVPRRISDALARQGIKAPFAIQSLTIADALAGRDLCGRAPTGSGKTLAFGIPLAVLAAKGAPRRPSALVLVPTRELAAQVAQAVRPLAQARGLRTATFYGGTSINKDQGLLGRGVDIAIACPGRLADLVQRGAVNLGDVRTVVLDEADRMADMGFLPEVKRLLDRTNPERQTLLFSATLDGDVDVLIRRYQRDPVRHELAEEQEEAGEVTHLFWSTGSQERLSLTADLVREHSSAIVFTRTKHAADRVARQLSRHGVAAAAIHGNRSQGQRERALADFAARRVSALVATDVAARGIHVDDVQVVVHFDPAGTDKDYVHRSGRTGRAGADGLVVTMVIPEKAKDVRGLQRGLGLPQSLTTPDGATIAAPPAPKPAPTNGPKGGSGNPRSRNGRNGRSGRSGKPRSRSGDRRRQPAAAGRAA